MNADRAQVLAESLHHGQRDRGGAPLIEHVGRVAATVPRHARVVAWLHEALEHASVSEEALLAKGLSIDELRALRLLTRDLDSRSDTIYLAHIDLLARARGPGADIARTVKRADLDDRMLHPSPAGFPPRARAQILRRRPSAGSARRSEALRHV